MMHAQFEIGYLEKLNNNLGYLEKIKFINLSNFSNFIWKLCNITR